MGLADWLVDGDNPLTARVLVNRFWIMVLGKVLYALLRNLDYRASILPIQNSLIGWQSIFKNGWNLKRLLKQMIISKTFRQNSAIRIDLNDPENKLWARGPSYRLDAEVLRILPCGRVVYSTEN